MRYENVPLPLSHQAGEEGERDVPQRAQLHPGVVERVPLPAPLRLRCLPRRAQLRLQVRRQSRHRRLPRAVERHGVRLPGLRQQLAHAGKRERLGDEHAVQGLLGAGDEHRAEGGHERLGVELTGGSCCVALHPSFSGESSL